MIKKIILRNFQSHEDTEIDLNNTMNVIIGDSDSGKSAIRRAVQCLTRAIPFYLRFGADEGFVQVDFDDCSVTRVYKRINTTKCPSCKEPLGENKRVCGECGAIIQDKPAADYYIVDGQKYEKFGVTLPPMIIEKLRICDVVFGDLSVNINIQTQFDDMFFIGKKFDGNNRNKLISGLVPDSEKVDIAIKDLNAEKNDIRSELRFLDNEYSANLNKIELVKSDIDELKELYQNIEALQLRIDEDAQTYNEILTINDILKQMGNLSAIGDFLSNQGDVLNKAMLFIDKIMNKIDKYNDIDTINNELSGLSIANVSLPDINLLNISKDIVEELQVKTKLFDDISQTSDIYKNTKVTDVVIPPALSKEKVEALLDKVETTILKIKDIETIKSTLTATDEETNKLTEQTEKLCSEKTKIQSEFKDSNGDLICPHSGDVYADECLVRFCK